MSFQSLLNISLITEYSVWWLLMCPVVGFFYAFIFYKNEKRFEEVNVLIKRVMFFFRFVVVTGLCFLLLSPLLKTVFNKTEKPIIVVAQDNSSSILLNKDSIFYQTSYLEKLEALKNQLSEDYEVKFLSFSDQIDEVPKIDFSGKTTNLSNVFNEIENRYYNQNVGAIVLASDGIFNEGSNPVYTAQTNGVPVYTIALGDTTPQKDVIVKEVISNKLTFLGNKFPVEILASVQEVQNQEIELTISDEKAIVFSKKYKIDKLKFSIEEELLLEAKKIGINHYKVKLSNIEGEISYTNNTKDFYIDVLDGRQEILLLASAPHPDLKALKLSIEKNENYKTTTQFLNEFDGNLSKYSMAILHQIPSSFPLSLKNSKIPIWYVLTVNSDIIQFNKLNTGLSIENYKGQSNDVFSTVNDQFPLFTLSDETQKRLNKGTPLVSLFGVFKQANNGYPLFFQKVRGIETESPLMVFFENEGRKSAVLAGEGIWRWRMLEFQQNKHHHAFDEWVTKTVQYLSVKEDKSKFKVLCKNEYSENEEILINAELYNDSYELMNDPEVNLQIVNESGETFEYIFNKSSKSYFINSGIFNPGNYQYKASTKWMDKVFTATGQFQVLEILLESNNTIANHQLLNNLSDKFGGNMFFPNQMKELLDEIDKNQNIASIIYEEKDLKELINFKWIFILLLILLSAEWFLRKRNGAY